MTLPAPDEADRWHPWLERAARLAMRGHGNAEPNPMVGCVILDAQDHLAGEGYHRRYGGAHAEIEALTRAGARSRGGTALVTLEPCNHHGRTPPCSDALLRAGIARVVYVCADPHPLAAGGAAHLRANGVSVLHMPCELAQRVTAPFLHRVRTGLPWVCVKWALTHEGSLGPPRQPLPGYLGTQDHGPVAWVSSPRSRAMVHRERGRVDAILTGMGTVLADDPLLTVRTTHPRRIPARVVWDPYLQLPLDCALVRTASQAPLIVGTLPPGSVGAANAANRAGNTAADGVGNTDRHTAHAQALRQAGATLLHALDLHALLRQLHAEHRVCTVLVEAGAGLVKALLHANLVNEAWVFVAQPPAAEPGAKPDTEPGSNSEAWSPDSLGCAQLLTDAGFAVLERYVRAPDLLLHYWPRT